MLQVTVHGFAIGEWDYNVAPRDDFTKKLAESGPEENAYIQRRKWSKICISRISYLVHMLTECFVLRLHNHTTVF